VRASSRQHERRGDDKSDGKHLDFESISSGLLRRSKHYVNKAVGGQAFGKEVGSSVVTNP
jgi:hypothetical protein